MAANPDLQLTPPEFSSFLSDLEAAIERSRSMLGLPDNWDDDGGGRIEPATWDRAASFLRDNAERLLLSSHAVIGTPVISPVGDGSVDIHWRDTRRQLLINVPAEAEEPIEFFGDDRGRTVVKGTIDPSVSTLWLLMWLTR